MKHRSSSILRGAARTCSIVTAHSRRPGALLCAYITLSTRTRRSLRGCGTRRSPGIPVIAGNSGFPPTILTTFPGSAPSAEMTRRRAPIPGATSQNPAVSESGSAPPRAHAASKGIRPLKTCSRGRRGRGCWWWEDLFGDSDRNVPIRQFGDSDLNS